MIRIQNIYYMLSYAFRVLRAKEYQKLAAEPFTNAADLLAAILVQGVSVQVKRGLRKTYQQETERTSRPKGKIDLSCSIKQQTMLRNQVICSYDVFSVNSYLNRILKTTLALLLRFELPINRKKDIRKVLIYFKETDLLPIRSIRWHLQYNRGSQSYPMLISVCYLVVKGLLQTQSDGSFKLMNFLDEQRMCRLYEKFILEYYRKEHPELHASSSQVPWALEDSEGFMLPRMQTDIMLTYRDKTLILDAKYYDHATRTHYDQQTLYSAHLYQIFTYVKNQAVLGGTVSGMLLYAKTEESIQPRGNYLISGNRIKIQTLDLDCESSELRAQLEEIAADFIDHD